MNEKEGVRRGGEEGGESGGGRNFNNLKEVGSIRGNGTFPAMFARSCISTVPPLHFAFNTHLLPGRYILI